MSSKDQVFIVRKDEFYPAKDEKLRTVTSFIIRPSRQTVIAADEQTESGEVEEHLFKTAALIAQKTNLVISDGPLLPAIFKAVEAIT